MFQFDPKYMPMNAVFDYDDGKLYVQFTAADGETSPKIYGRDPVELFDTMAGAMRSAQLVHTINEIAQDN